MQPPTVICEELSIPTRGAMQGRGGEYLRTACWVSSPEPNWFLGAQSRHEVTKALVHLNQCTMTPGYMALEEPHTNRTLSRRRGRKEARPCCAVPFDAHAAARALDPNVPLPGRGLALAATGQYVNGHGLIDVQRCHMAVFEGVDESVAGELGIEDPKHQGEGQWSVDQQVPIALHVAAVLGIMVDRMRVVRKGTVLKQEFGRGC